MAAAAALLAAANLALAAAALWDDDLMPFVDEYNEQLASDIALHKTKEVQAGARELDDLFAQVEAAFTARGDVPEAVKFARESRELIKKISSQAGSGDFDTAARTAIEFSRSCKTCHLKYKP